MIITDEMWIWLAFLFGLTVITFYGYKRVTLIALLGMILSMVMIVPSVEAFGELWMMPFSLLLVNIVIAVIALTRRY